MSRTLTWVRTGVRLQSAEAWLAACDGSL